MAEEASTHNGLKIVYSINDVGKIGLIHAKKKKLDHFLVPHTRINTKHRQQNYRHCSQQYFIGYISTGKGNKRKINKWDYIKLKSFHAAKEIINKIKRQPSKRENIFANTSDKGLIPKIYKELTKLNTKKTNNPIKNGQSTWVDTSLTRTQRWPTGIWKDAHH